MNWLRGGRGLVLRAMGAAALAVFAAIGTLPIWPRWVSPIVVALHKPLATAWYFLLPSQDAYFYYVPVGFNLSFLLFVAFAMLVYLVIMYVPTWALAVWRATRLAWRTPAPFVAYAVAGALFGGVLGFLGWAASNAVASRDALFNAVMTGSAIVGWLAAVVRCAVERRLLRASL